MNILTIPNGVNQLMKFNLSEYWVNRGNEFRETENYEEAVLCYEEAVVLDSEDASVFNICGVALVELARIRQDEALFEKAFKNFEIATRLKSNYKDAFYNWGFALSCLTEIKQDEVLFERAFENFGKATDPDTTDPNDASVFYAWGISLSEFAEIKRDVSSFEEAYKKFEKATELDPTNDAVFYSWGISLSGLAGIKREETLYEEAFEKLDKAIRLNSSNAEAIHYWGGLLYRLSKNKQYGIFQKGLDAFEKIMDSDVFLTDKNEALLVKGSLYFALKRDDSDIGIALDCFKKSRKSVLEILPFLYENKNAKSLLLLLGSNDTNDGKFFDKIIKEYTRKTNIDFSQEQIEKYKKVYLRSMSIIIELHVIDKNERRVAHYCGKNVSQKLLFGNDENPNKFWLNAINYSNDPSEGKTLLDFLYGGEKKLSYEELNTDYEIFAGCFTFNYDSLNQFRLYGKDGEKEGTGLSLVFRDSFFSNKAKTAMDSFEMRTASESPKKDSCKTNMNGSRKEVESALFRCIYIDPNPETKLPVVTVGQKEEYLFYREKIGHNFEKYGKKIKKTVNLVRKEMDKLKKLVTDNDLDFVIVGQLLINLRYLIKHVAFKEEQECRIVKIRNLTEDKLNLTEDKGDRIKNNGSNLYLEYSPKVADHIHNVYFGPKAVGFELFQSMLKMEGLNIPCEISKNPLA